jgi:hypothetical protein
MDYEKTEESAINFVYLAMLNPMGKILINSNSFLKAQ